MKIHSKEGTFARKGCDGVNGRGETKGLSVREIDSSVSQRIRSNPGYLRSIPFFWGEDALLLRRKRVSTQLAGLGGNEINWRNVERGGSVAP